MPTDALRIVQQAMTLWNSGDVTAALERAAPDCVIDLSHAKGPYRGVYRVGDAVRVHAAFLESWGERRQEIGEPVEVGDHVLVPFTDRFSGRDGIAVEASGVWAWTLRDGVIVRLCLYQALDQALEALGPDSVG